jgi:hypothetical protein
MLTPEAILEVLRPVQDPELPKSLVELNMIREVKIEGGNVSFTLVLTTPACPLREFIVEDCQKLENMSYFIPPDLPDRRYDLFGSGGGEKTSKEVQIPLLGCVPLEISLREGGDQGIPIVISTPDCACAQALTAIAQQIAAKVSMAALLG